MTMIGRARPRPSAATGSDERSTGPSRPPFSGIAHQSDGPAHRALAAIAVSALGRAGRGVQAAELAVEISPNPRLGDFRIQGCVDEDHASLLAEVSAGLQSSPGVIATVDVPPRVYVKLTVAALRDAIVPEILARPHTYGNASMRSAGEPVEVTFSDPNLNKPLHLGHLRNNFLGMALVRLAESQGCSVRTSELVSDWGLHICEALAAYQRWGEGTTPESVGVPGDEFVGAFYVRFPRQEAVARDAGAPGDGHDRTDPALDAEALLRRLEGADEGLRRASSVLTGWAEEGIRRTYRRIGSRMDAVFSESHYVEASARLVETGLDTGVLQRRSDGSVYIDLRDRDLGEPTLVRQDGTQVIYARVLGAYVARHEAVPIQHMVSVLGHDWERGVQIVTETLARLGYTWARNILPVHYGMVRLIEGRMRSRSGAIIGANALLDRASVTIRKALESADVELPQSKMPEVCETVAAGLIKYHLLGVRRTKDVVFDEDLLITSSFPDFAKLLNMARPSQPLSPARIVTQRRPEALRPLLLHLNAFPSAVSRSLHACDPSILVQYVNGLSRKARPVTRRSSPDGPEGDATSIVVRRALELLNIELPLDWPSLPASAGGLF